MSNGLVTIFGGGGFVGRYAARALINAGWRVRIAVRRPNIAGDVRLAGTPGWVDLVQANIRHKASVTAAIEGADAVINLVGILYQKGPQSFDKTHREGAINIAEACVKAGITRLVQVSAIGADPEATSNYARTKGEAEVALRKILPGTVILRPSVVFGPEDNFFNRFAGMAAHSVSSFLPFLPAIGGGKTKLQPIYAGDIAEAIAAAVTRQDAGGQTYELGGPRQYSLVELYRYISSTVDRKRYALPIPFLIAKPLGLTMGAAWRYLLFGLFGAPPLSGDQVESLKHDNVVADGAKTLVDLGITDLESVEAIVPSYLWRFRPYGQYNQSSEA